MTGQYIVIEGNDGTGKSTQVELLGQRLQSLGISSVEVHEPGGIPIADEIREIIKNGSLERDGLVNVLLFTASRRAIWQQQIEPSLQKGTWALSARNWISTLAYQGNGEGVDKSKIRELTEQYVGTKYCEPDMVFILDLSDAHRADRIAKRGSIANPDTFESRGNDFQDRVNEGYRSYALSEGLTVIDASKSIEQVHEEIWAHVQERIA